MRTQVPFAPTVRGINPHGIRLFDEGIPVTWSWLVSGVEADRERKEKLGEVTNGTINTNPGCEASCGGVYFS